MRPPDRRAVIPALTPRDQRRHREEGLAMLPMMILMAFPLLGIVLFFVLPPGLAIPLYVLGLILSGVTHWAMMRSMRVPVQTGAKGMTGARGEVIWWNGSSGYIRCHGEVWRARSAAPTTLGPGEEVEVREVQPGEEMVLLVAPAAEDLSRRSGS